MREMMQHRPGRIFLSALVLSVVAYIVVAFLGWNEVEVLLFGWINAPLLIGAGFVAFWLICYLIYFFFFWPYR